MPAPYARQTVTLSDLTQRTPEAHAYAEKLFRTFISGNEQFYPFNVGKRTIIAPGFDGGSEWGGPGVDPTKDIIYVNANNVVYTGGLVKTILTQGSVSPLSAPVRSLSSWRSRWFSSRISFAYRYRSPHDR